MFKFYKLVLTFIIGLMILQGCNAVSTEEELFIDENNTIELNVTVLVEGDQPVIGNSGSKRLVLIDNADEFITLWGNYTNENLPTIDFDSQVVALYDMGGERNSNSCDNDITLTNISAERIHTSVSTISVNLSKNCPSEDVACTALYTPSRPFTFVSLAKSDETLMSEDITIEKCD